MPRKIDGKHGRRHGADPGFVAGLELPRLTMAKAPG